MQGAGEAYCIIISYFLSFGLYQYVYLCILVHVHPYVIDTIAYIQTFKYDFWNLILKACRTLPDPGKHGARALTTDTI